MAGSQGCRYVLVLVVVFSERLLGVPNSGRIWVSGAGGSLANGYEQWFVQYTWHLLHSVDHTSTTGQISMSLVSKLKPGRQYG